jgi:hypothetical protein
MAQADIARAKAVKSVAIKPVLALDEIFLAIKTAKGVMEKLKPKCLGGSGSGNDLDRYGAWFDRVLTSVALLAKYQLPAIKPVELPTPAPEVKEERIVFGLRVFEGGKPVHEIEDEDEED